MYYIKVSGGWKDGGRFTSIVSEYGRNLFVTIVTSSSRAYIGRVGLFLMCPLFFRLFSLAAFCEMSRMKSNVRDLSADNGVVPLLVLCLWVNGS